MVVRLRVRTRTLYIRCASSARDCITRAGRKIFFRSGDYPGSHRAAGDLPPEGLVTMDCDPNHRQFGDMASHCRQVCRTGWGLHSVPFIGRSSPPSGTCCLQSRFARSNLGNSLRTSSSEFPQGNGDARACGADGRGHTADDAHQQRKRHASSQQVRRYPKRKRQVRKGLPVHGAGG
jgi:hypothetical protein